MNFELTDSQADIKAAARDMLRSALPTARLQQLADARQYDTSLCASVVELGWTGITVDERYGGAELGLIELCVVMEELGYAVAPIPFLSSVAASLALRYAGSPEQQQRWLPAIASGEAQGTVGIITNGVATLVPDASAASVLCIVEDGRMCLMTADQVEVTATPTIDLTRRFGNVVLNESGEDMPGDRDMAASAVALAVAAESVGVAHRAMDTAVEYAKSREQFGEPIGVHQAVSHRCAQMLLEVEGARSAVYYAAWAGDHEPSELALAAASAKAYASDVGWRVPAAAVQVLGGIGFTWQHELHYSLRRGRLNSLLYGGASHHLGIVGDIIAATGAR